MAPSPSEPHAKGLRIEAPRLDVTRVATHAAYMEHRRASAEIDRQREAVERGLLPKERVPFTVDGWCWPCGAARALQVDWSWAPPAPEGEIGVPNWRERLLCPVCQLNNRLRASMQVVGEICGPDARPIYATEQDTPLFRALKARHPDAVGSEYLGDDLPSGHVNARGIRHESLTGLSFESERFGLVLTFDVLEHVPAFGAALKEIFRVLRPGGLALVSVPFVRTAAETLVRARITPSGEVEHLLPPEYHGDPLREDGCLCFYHYGWDLLDAMRGVGFEDACGLLYWSRSLGYLGGEQLILSARRPG